MGFMLSFPLKRARGNAPGYSQTLGFPLRHLLLLQLALFWQTSPLHRKQPEEAGPQSIPVSVPFWKPSKQVGSTQEFSMQIPEAQSGATKHLCPSAQRPQVPPPQSTSVSLPL